MRMSEKRRDALYAAIREPLARKRLKIGKFNYVHPSAVDQILYQLELDIWCGVRKALGLDEAPDVEVVEAEIVREVATEAIYLKD